MKQTPRASSLVENLNSRRSNYFFLRGQLGPQYFKLLRFFLNHRTFMRSECPERVGETLAQMMLPDVTLKMNYGKKLAVCKICKRFTSDSTKQA